MRLQEGSAGDLGAWMGSQVLEARCPFPHNAAEGLGAAWGLWDAQLGWKWELPALKKRKISVWGHWVMKSYRTDTDFTLANIGIPWGC